MIWESGPWKQDIARRAEALRQCKSQKHWSEALEIQAEQHIFFAAYVVRKLMESFKVSDEVESSCVDLKSFGPRDMAVDIVNWDRVDELYDLDADTSIRMCLKDFCNQIIHSFIFLLVYDKQNNNLTGFMVASDRDKEKQLLYIDIDAFLAMLVKVTKDEIANIHMKRDAVGKPMKVISKTNQQGITP